MQYNSVKNSVSCIIIDAEHLTGFNNKPISSIEICGKTILDMVKFAVKDFDTQVIKVADENEDIIKIIKPFLKDTKYTLVLFADTPLLTAKTIYTMIDYISLKSIIKVKTDRAYIFDTAYIKNIDKLYSNCDNFICPNPEEFYPCSDTISYVNIQNILHNRIINYHLNNDVLIKNPSSVFIDSTVVIEPGTTIEPNNIITGKTKILKNTIIKSGNRISDSLIGENNVVDNSVISNVITKSNVTIEPYCILTDMTLIQENSKIGSFCRIKKKTILPNSTIKTNTIME